MYAAQSMKNKWYGMFGGDMMEEDSDQDSLKVCNLTYKYIRVFGKVTVLSIKLICFFSFFLFFVLF